MAFPFRLQSGAEPRAIVFDLDETLIACDSTQCWTEWLYETGTVTDPAYRNATRTMVERYRAGTLDIREFLRDMAPALEGLTREALDRLIDRFITERILPNVYPEGRALIAEARAAGLHIGIISATAAYLVRPIALRLGVHEAIGIDLATKDGIPTAEVVGTPSFREGKIVRLAEWLEKKNGEGYFTEGASEGSLPPVTPADVFFFTDSRNDLPLALHAGGCALVNPDPTIRAEGLKRGCPVLAWKVSDGNPA